VLSLSLNKGETIPSTKKFHWNFGKNPMRGKVKFHGGIFNILVTSLFLIATQPAPFQQLFSHFSLPDYF